MYVKINIVYRTNEGKPWVLPVVSSTETAIAADKTLNHEYLSIDGMKEFYETASKLILGADSPAIIENRVSYFINYHIKYSIFLVSVSSIF